MSHTTAAQVIDFAQAARRKHRDEHEEWHLTWDEMPAFLSRNIMGCKLTYRALGQQAGISPTTISRMAAGETHNPSHRTVTLLLDVLGFDWVVR